MSHKGTVSHFWDSFLVQQGNSGSFLVGQENSVQDLAEFLCAARELSQILPILSNTREFPCVVWQLARNTRVNAVRPLQKTRALPLQLAEVFPSLSSSTRSFAHRFQSITRRFRPPAQSRKHPPRDHLYTGDCSRLTVDHGTGCTEISRALSYARARHTSPLGTALRAAPPGTR